LHAFDPWTSLDFHCIVKEIAAISFCGFHLHNGTAVGFILNSAAVHLDHGFTKDLSVRCNRIGLVLKEMSLEIADRLGGELDRNWSNCCSNFAKPAVPAIRNNVICEGPSKESILFALGRRSS
jgi:hypothetical protein